MVKEIRFYRVTDPHGELSNFAPYPVYLKGKSWPTAEHYFQAQKFSGTEHEEAIRLAKSPMVAARMGRSRKRPLRSDWEQIKEQIMIEAIRAKFSQHEELTARLLETGDARLMEHTPKDSFWGDGGDGSGRNRLGQLLMQVRQELKLRKETPVAKRKRDVEKAYPASQFVDKLRRLADAIEQGRRFRIQVAGERISVPPSAMISVEHERGEDGEELELQLKWPLGS